MLTRLLSSRGGAFFTAVWLLLACCSVNPVEAKWRMTAAQSGQQPTDTSQVEGVDNEQINSMDVQVDVEVDQGHVDQGKNKGVESSGLNSLAALQQSLPQVDVATKNGAREVLCSPNRQPLGQQRRTGLEGDLRALQESLQVISSEQKQQEEEANAKAVEEREMQARIQAIDFELEERDVRRALARLNQHRTPELIELLAKSRILVGLFHHFPDGAPGHRHAELAEEVVDEDLRLVLQEDEEEPSPVSRGGKFRRVAEDGRAVQVLQNQGDHHDNEVEVKCFVQAYLKQNLHEDKFLHCSIDRLTSYSSDEVRAAVARLDEDGDAELKGLLTWLHQSPANNRYMGRLYQKNSGSWVGVTDEELQFRRVLRELDFLLEKIRNGDTGPRQSARSAAAAAFSPRVKSVVLPAGRSNLELEEGTDHEPEMASGEHAADKPNQDVENKQDEKMSMQLSGAFSSKALTQSELNDLGQKYDDDALAELLPLPHPWVEHQHDDAIVPGEKFFFNPHTEEKTVTRPRRPPMGENWRGYRSADGQIAYCNLETGHTQKEHPGDSCTSNIMQQGPGRGNYMEVAHPARPRRRTTLGARQPPPTNFALRAFRQREQAAARRTTPGEDRNRGLGNLEALRRALPPDGGLSSIQEEEEEQQVGEDVIFDTTSGDADADLLHAEDEDAEAEQQQRGGTNIIQHQDSWRPAPELQFRPPALPTLLAVPEQLQHELHDFPSPAPPGGGALAAKPNSRKRQLERSHNYHNGYLRLPDFVPQEATTPTEPGVVLPPPGRESTQMMKYSNIVPRHAGTNQELLPKSSTERVHAED
ncbi:unnamed protein product [Amoebophrya sp. A120]|nr:unnamed protein product [Amoebophrya sp. A120]|eukprot:GSA120T00008273001.1